MGFLRRLRVDLQAETPTTAYYLPVTLPVDLDRYSNENLDDAAMFAMKLDLAALGFTAQGMRRTHTAPNLLRDMAALGITRSIVLPFDLPVGAQNTESHHGGLRASPTGSCRSARCTPTTATPRPGSTGTGHKGAHGVKLHPNGQFIAPDHPRTVRLCGCCGDRGLPVLFHCGPVGIEPAASAPSLPGARATKQPSRSTRRRRSSWVTRGRSRASRRSRSRGATRTPTSSCRASACPRCAGCSSRFPRTASSTARTGPSTTRP